MPVTQPTPPFARIKVFSRCGACEALNTHFYAATALPPPIVDSDVQTWADAWLSGYVTLWQDVMASDVELLYVEAAVRTTSVLLEATSGSGAMGGRAGQAIPFQDCGMIIWEYSIVGARISRGKTFLSGLAEGDTAASEIDAAVVTNMQALADYIRQSQTIAGNTLYHGIWCASYNTFAETFGGSAKPYVRTLRNRRPLS